MRVAVLGLGNMGRSVAQRLLEAGHEVTVWNRSRGKELELVEAGARAAESPADAVDGVSAVLLALSDDAAVRSVVSGSDGVASALGTSAVLVDLSTVSPVTTTETAERVGRERMLAAPILGAPSAVAGGAAVYLLAGPPSARRRVEGLWPSLTSTVRDCGDEPAGATTVKLLCNYLLMSGLVMLSEVVATGQAVGMTDNMLRDLLGQVPLVPPALLNRLDDVIDGDHVGWFAARLGAKDVRLAEEMATAAGVSLTLAGPVRDSYERLADLGLADADIAAVVEVFRRPDR